jgi:hypothetical protein
MIFQVYDSFDDAVRSFVKDTSFVLYWIYDTTRTEENYLLLSVWMQRNIDTDINIVQFKHRHRYEYFFYIWFIACSITMVILQAL